MPIRLIQMTFNKPQIIILLVMLSIGPLFRSQPGEHPADITCRWGS